MRRLDGMSGGRSDPLHHRLGLDRSVGFDRPPKQLNAGLQAGNVPLKQLNDIPMARGSSLLDNQVESHCILVPGVEERLHARTHGLPLSAEKLFEGCFMSLVAIERNDMAGRDGDDRQLTLGARQRHDDFGTAGLAGAPGFGHHLMVLELIERRKSP
jgi:hypothetical protein